MIAEVYPLLPVKKSFSYTFSERDFGKELFGKRVVIKFGKRTCVGIVCGVREENGEKLDSIISVIDTIPIISEKMFTFLKLVSDYYLYPLGELLRLSIPSSFRMDKVTKRKMQSSRSFEKYWFSTYEKSFTLTNEQKTVFYKICRAVERGIFSPFLLHGVCGSGKTAIYIELAKVVKNLGKQSLILVPEIALTPQLASQFHSVFGESVSIFHSGLTKAEKEDVWMGSKDGRFSLVVGTRSSIFLPLERLGLIVVDEEHDPSYKQEERIRYNARDLAVLRAKIFRATVVLGTATPSLESYFNAKKGRYSYLFLPKRVDGKKMPKIEIVDMRKEKNPIFSKLLIEKMERELSLGQQVILFLNRKGFSTIICRDCGRRVMCPRCSVALVYHKDAKRLLCHICGFKDEVPKRCKACGGRLFFFGFGIEKVEEEVRKIFPSKKIVRMERNISIKRELKKILQDIREKKVDIIIGTQILAKGHHFEGVSLVGVVLADIALNLPDFRASERVYQLLVQVAGRSGRGDREGEVVIQSYNPSHRSILYCKRFDSSFFEEELKDRRALLYPPFSRLTNILFEGKDKEKVEALAYSVSDFLKEFSKEDFYALGPTLCPIWMVKGRYRYQIVLKSRDRKSIRDVAKSVLEKFSRRKGVTLKIDVDPYFLL